MTSPRLAAAERNLMVRWVIATVVGWAVGFYVCETFVSGLSLGFSYATEGAVIGAFVGLAQGWVLRNQIGGMWWWLLACVIGFAIGKAVGQSAASGMALPFGYLTTGAIIGLVAGFAQWLTLRSRVPRAAWWLLASVIGWAAGWSLVASVNGSPDVSTPVVYLVGGVGAAVAGVVTAAVLLWALRARSITQAPVG